MPVSLIPSFLSFCFINGITPGPANLCSLSTAMNEGKQAALRQWRGLFTGFAIVSLGSAWMAWNIIRPVFLPGSAKERQQDRSAGKASFWSGLFVQLTNVKIIVFCMTALSSFVLPYTKDFLSLLLVGAFLPFTGPVCNLAWLFDGVKLQKLFQQHRMVISLLMALSLVYCVISLVS